MLRSDDLVLIVIAAVAEIGIDIGRAREEQFDARHLILICAGIPQVGLSLGGTIILKGAPLKGTIEGTEDFNFQIGDPSGIDLVIVGSGGGFASHLGILSATWEGDITFGPDPNALQPLDRAFVAANGDELWSEGWGVGTPPDADRNFNQYVVEEHLITGGTGRFEDATGSFTVERVVYDVRLGIDLVTEGSFDGVIVLK